MKIEKTTLSELLRDNIIDAIETSRKSTIILSKLQQSEIINQTISDELNWIFDGLFKLLDLLYVTEILDKETSNWLYDTFQLYLEGDSKGPKTIQEFFKLVEGVE